MNYYQLFVVSVICVSLFVSAVFGEDAVKKITDLRIGVKKRIPADECTVKSEKGDVLSMHYTGTLHADGSKFDSSLDRGDPFKFTLGMGQVIKGWDQGLVGMCIGEKRRLVIPSELGYGEHGSPPKIPGNSVLVFEVELLDIEKNKSEQGSGKPPGEL